MEQKALLEAIGESVSPRSIKKKQQQTATKGAEQHNNWSAAATAKLAETPIMSISVGQMGAVDPLRRTQDNMKKMPESSHLVQNP